MRLYDELAAWYPLLSAPGSYEIEGAHYRALLAQHGAPSGTLLELGCGAGTVAMELAGAYALTLSDLSPAMLAVASARVPGGAAVVGDMRTLRLTQRFDAVLCHDAIMYMLDERDLLAAMATAYVHLRPGGVALFVPDATRDNFRPGEMMGGCDAHDGTRGLRFLQWVHDVDATSYAVELALLLRQGATVRAVHETHRHGLFSRATWRTLLGEAGFVVHDRDEQAGVFVGVRPDE